MPEDVSHVRDFFSHWAAYEAAVRANYLYHREMTAAFNANLRNRGYIGSMLDLGCGDGGPVPAITSGCTWASYTGIDVTPEALDLARAAARDWNVPAAFILGDFLEQLSQSDDSYDTILVSLAMHHLPNEDKPAFFDAVLARLEPGGVLLAYEPACRPGEDRLDYAMRQGADFQSTFTQLTSQQTESINQHVLDSDYPASPGEYAAMAIDAGFAEAQLLFRDPHDYWAAMAFTHRRPRSDWR